MASTTPSSAPAGPTRDPRVAALQTFTQAHGGLSEAHRAALALSRLQTAGEWSSARPRARSTSSSGTLAAAKGRGPTRFGPLHHRRGAAVSASRTKNSFKQLRSNGVDVLTLSATPIPRTLSMGHERLRDMSISEEAARSRHPVQTLRLEHDWGSSPWALRANCARRAQGLFTCTEPRRLYRLLAPRGCGSFCPNGRIASPTARWRGAAFAIWQRLIEGTSTDPSVAQTSSKTGVDVPNCNTSFIRRDADHS
jgi:hypothetical protein